MRVSEGREKGRGATEFDARSFCLDKLSTICKSFTKVVVSGSMRFDPSSLPDSVCVKISVTCTLGGLVIGVCVVMDVLVVRMFSG